MMEAIGMREVALLQPSLANISKMYPWPSKCHYMKLLTQVEQTVTSRKGKSKTAFTVNNDLAAVFASIQTLLLLSSAACRATRGTKKGTGVYISTRYGSGR